MLGLPKTLSELHTFVHATPLLANMASSQETQRTELTKSQLMFFFLHFNLSEYFLLKNTTFWAKSLPRFENI